MDFKQLVQQKLSPYLKDGDTIDPKVMHFLEQNENILYNMPIIAAQYILENNFRQASYVMLYASIPVSLVSSIVFGDAPNSETVLMTAVRKGHTDAAMRCILGDASLYLLNSKGQSLVDIAMECKADKRLIDTIHHKIKADQQDVPQLTYTVDNTTVGGWALLKHVAKPIIYRIKMKCRGQRYILEQLPESWVYVHSMVESPDSLKLTNQQVCDITFSDFVSRMNDKRLPDNVIVLEYVE